MMTKKDWECAIFVPLILHFLLSGGGGCTMTPMHLGWLLFYTTTAEEGEYMICDTLYMVIFLSLGDEHV